MSQNCDHLSEFMGEQKIRLGVAIDEDKWYLSERAHRDIGLEVAQKDFLDHYLGNWAKEFRENYCHNKCSERDKCSAIQVLL